MHSLTKPVEGATQINEVDSRRHHEPYSSSTASTTKEERAARGRRSAVVFPNMAGRSFKPASFLASAQPSMNNHRPSFARTSSSSSTHSTKSDESFFASLLTLSTADKREGDSTHSGSSGGASPRGHTPGDSTSSCQQFFDDTSSRKRSQPIAIEIPTRDRAAYTPLSARGDLPGGYFPNHETIQNHYKSHPFSRVRPQETEEPSSPMSNNSSAVASPALSDITPKAPSLAFQTPITAPETPILTMPMGKYHPSNYKLVSPSLSPAPTSSPVQPLPTSSMSLPQSKASNKRPHHERRTSDVKRKLQQYQRDMIAQARLASSHHKATGAGGGGIKPDSPKLVPLGSPGPITPFELEESAGYLIAGARAGGSAAQEKERDMVGRMIREEQRRVHSNPSQAVRF